MYSVILIDDEPVILEGLKKAIPWNEYGFEDIIAVQSAAQALWAPNNLTSVLPIYECLKWMD